MIQSLKIQSHIQSEQFNSYNADNYSPNTKKSGNFDSNVNKQDFNWNDSNSNYEDVYNEELLRKQRQLQEELEYQKQVEYAREKAYHDAYIQDLKNRGYKIRYKNVFF